MIMNNFLGRKPSLTYSLDISLGQFLLTEETIVAKKNQKWNLKTKILEFGFLLLWTVSWYNFDFGTTFFINYQIVCIYQEHKYRINIRNLSLSGFLGAYFLTLLKKDPVCKQNELRKFNHLSRISKFQNETYSSRIQIIF